MSCALSLLKGRIRNDRKQGKEKMPKLTEDAIEMMAIAELQKLGYRHFYGPDIAPDSANPQRSDFSDTLLPKLMSGEVRARMNAE